MARVMLVDDDPDLLEAVADALAVLGHHVRAVLDQRRAALEAANFRPDLVLLDGVLPGTSGAALARELHAAGHGRILFLTGLSRRELPEEWPMLRKPVGLDELQRAVERLTAAA